MNQLSIKNKTQVSKKKKKGFTLVELIIVIAIIAVLAAIAIPKFGAARHQADVGADQANAKIIATAVATAISNGDMDADTDVAAVDSDIYTPYIDGGTVPTAKTGTGFEVSYDAGDDGTGITISVTDGNQVYPASN